MEQHIISNSTCIDTTCGVMIVKLIALLNGIKRFKSLRLLETWKEEIGQTGSRQLEVFSNYDR